jgi:hypothetical protein
MPGRRWCSTRRLGLVPGPVARRTPIPCVGLSIVVLDMLAVGLRRSFEVDRNLRCSELGSGSVVFRSSCWTRWSLGVPQIVGGHSSALLGVRFRFSRGREKSRRSIVSCRRDATVLISTISTRESPTSRSHSPRSERFAASRRELAARCDGPDRDDSQPRENLTSLSRSPAAKGATCCDGPIATMSSGRTEGQPQSFCSEHHRRGYSASGRQARRSIAMILEPGTARLSRDWVTGPKRRTPGKRARRLSRGSIFRPQNAPGLDAVDRYVRERTHLVRAQWIGTSENKCTCSGRSGSAR